MTSVTSSTESATRPITTTGDVHGRAFTATAIFCIAFLAFIAGSLTMYLQVLPADILRRAFQGGLAALDRATSYADATATDLWQDARSADRGVVRHDPTKALQGLTLYSSSDDQRALLIDMQGRVVHQWALPYSQIWEKGSPVANPQRDALVYLEKAHVFPNGDLLALYSAIGDTPWGYGLVKMNRNSEVIWKYLGHAHHDFDIDANGNIVVLTQEISEAALPGLDDLNRPRIDDFIVKLSPDGKELDKLWMPGAFAQSPFGRRLRFAPWEAQHKTGDFLHANSVDILRHSIPGIAASRPGQVLVSFRDISTIALFDLEAQRVVWALTGPWFRQHDAQFLPNGRLLLFDNEGTPDIGYGRSRVLELDTATLAIVWSYGGRAQQQLDSVARASQTRLANGNTLVVESFGGRLLEVTPSGEVAWEFVNPVRGGPQGDRVPIISWAQRIRPQEDLEPSFRDRLLLN